MRILILTPDIDTRGGIARYSATLASVLGDLLGPQNVHALPLLAVGTPEENPAGYRKLEPVARRLTIASKFRFAAKALRLALRKYDLIICTHIGLSPVAALIRLLPGTPFWVTCHGREAWSRFPADVRWAVSQAGLLLPVSRFTAERISKVNGIPRSRIHVLYNAVPDGYAAMLALSNSTAPRSNAKTKHILSVGMVSRESRYKGYDTVIRALPKVLEAVPTAQYLVVGEGDDIGRLKRLAAELGVQDHVEFRGGVSDAELARCYRDCEVFVLPSRAERHDGGWHGEGFGRVYVEAALAGKPVIGSTGGGAAEAVLHQRTGLLVDPSSVAEVAEGLVQLLLNPGLAAQMGREGRRWAIENFTARSLRHRLAELLSGYGLPSPSAPLKHSGATQGFSLPENGPQASMEFRRS